MENPTHYDNNYESAKKRTKASYDKISRVWCPALNDHVTFKKIGFRHLIWKGAVMRPKNEQMRRFALLSYSAKILQNPNAKVVRRTGVNARFWAFTEGKDRDAIHVIVRQIGKQEKHFFSVFGGK